MQAQAAVASQAAAACWRDTLAEELGHTEDLLAQAAAAAVDPSSVGAAVDAAVCAQRAAAEAEAAEQAAEARAVRSALAAEVRVLEARLAAGAGAAAVQLAEQRAELEQLRADAIAEGAASCDVAARRAVEGYVLLSDEMRSLRDAADPAGAEARLAAAASPAAAEAAAAAAAAVAEAAELRAELASGRARIDQLQAELAGLRPSSQEADITAPKQDMGVQVYATWTDDVTDTSRPNSRQQRDARDAASSARYLLSSREGGRPRSRSGADVTPKLSRSGLEAKLQQLQARGGCSSVHPRLQPCMTSASQAAAPYVLTPGCSPVWLSPQAHEAEAEEERQGRADAAAARILQLEASLAAAESAMGDEQAQSYILRTMPMTNPKPDPDPNPNPTPHPYANPNPNPNPNSAPDPNPNR